MMKRPSGRPTAIVDFGPGPGIAGGEIVVNGDLADLLRMQRIAHRSLSYQGR